MKSTLMMIFLLSNSLLAGNLSSLVGSGGGGSTSSLTFAGYTAAYGGNLGRVKGANNYCNAAFSGSHWCTDDEIARLGNNYPFTYEAVINFNVSFVALSGAGCYWMSALGPFSVTTPTTTEWACADTFSCVGNTQSSASYHRPTLSTTGIIYNRACNSSYRLACCK